MIVGKTSVSKSEIFSKYSELEVLTTVFPEINRVPCKIRSPFRVDSNPSFSIYMNDDRHICFKDHGDKDCRGGLLDLLCKYWNCSFHQVFDRILSLMQDKKKGNDISIKPKQLKVLTRKETAELTKLQVSVRPWREYDYRYWKSYGIEKQWLKYAEIYPISHKIIYKKDKETGHENKYIFSADKYAYAYVERKDDVLSLKIYQPFNKKGFKWCMKMNKSVISLWTKIPEHGKELILCSSVKDALCISCNLHIPTIALQGEGYKISNTALRELKRRYNDVYISYDGDDAGKEDAVAMSKATGFPVIKCPILDTQNTTNEDLEWLCKEGLQRKDKAKDWSDIYLYFGKEKFIEEFNRQKTTLNYE